jgi:hypothetical protein
MSNEYIVLEFYEIDHNGKMVGEDPIMYATHVSVVPRVGERLHLSRTEKVLGIDPDKEHRYWVVDQVEWWYETETKSMIRNGAQRNVVVFCKRLPTSPYRLERD